MAVLRGLARYQADLDQLMARQSDDFGSFVDQATPHLDGFANAEYRRLTHVGDRRRAGTFFTGTELRARLVQPYRRKIASGAKVFDPACGMGDLLLGAAEALPASWTRRRRVQHAIDYFSGTELLEPLASLASRRLALWAAVEGAVGIRPEAFAIEPTNAFSETVAWHSKDLVLLNPPFTLGPIGERKSWASGTVTAAAPFVVDVLERCKPGTTVAAILPDVLRSGSRYALWREHVEKLGKVEAIEVVGPFDAWTDVDVFITRLRVRRQPKASGTGVWVRGSTAGATVKDFASVAVGDVVPHRHRPDESSPMVPYLTTQSAPVGETINDAPGSVIRFAGRLHTPPFVLVRRTSAPTKTDGKTPRLRTTIYSGSEPAAVENHLVVIRPSSGRLEDCVLLADRILVRPETTEWLNQRIRARHLTVGVLKELPMEPTESANPDE